MVTPELSAIALPRQRSSGPLSVAEAIARRRSQRDFTDEAPSRRDIATLCWAAQGITDAPEGLRASPSAGALFPMTLYVADAGGVHEYLPGEHALRPLLAGDVRARLQAAALDQPCVGDAPVCFVIVMDVRRTARRYGGRAERYCLMEAGHIAQNILLTATALGLGGVPVGAFDEAEVAGLLKLPKLLEPAYLLPVGHPVVSETKGER